MRAEQAVRTTGATYDVIAPAYAARATVTPVLRAHLERFAELLPDEGRVLDVGSGPGYLAEVLAERGVRVAALDTSAAMLRLAARRVPAVRADLRRLPVRPGALDGIWANASLLHVPRAEVPGTLAGWHSALRPGGAVGLSTATGADGEQGWEEVAFPVGGAPGAPAPRRWFVLHPEARLRGLIADAGFTLSHADTYVTHRTWFQAVAVRAG